MSKIEKIVRISSQKSKKWSNQRNKGTRSYHGVFEIIKCLYFFDFDHILDFWAEILTIFSLLFWKILDSESSF